MFLPAATLARRASRFLALSAAIATAACSGEVIAPTASQPHVPGAPALSFTPTSGRPALTANSVKYRDSGAKPSTGRSGTASIMSRALLGKDGVTLVEATTGSLDGGASPGQISKAQTKFASGDSVITRNFNGLAGNGYFSTTIPGLTANSLVQVQTNVRGIDPKRTDVVTVMDSVKLRPDLSVSDLSVANKARINTVVNVVATIRELNGDVGARSNCVLTVDGVQVDQAAGIWTDAGDAVSCAFVHTFTTLGTRQVAVTASSVVPADWDLANNSASASIDIVAPEARMNWYMNFWGQDRTYNYSYSYYDWWYGYYSWGHSGSTWDRQAHVSGWANDAAPRSGEMTFTGTLSMDGSTVASETATGFDPSWYGSDCRVAYTASNMQFQFCQYGQTSNLWAYQYSGRHVYYGWEYYGYYGYYSWSGDYSWGAGAYAVGSTAAFGVKATDQAGNVWRIDASTPVTSNQFSYQCNYWWYYGCSGGESGTTYSGFNTGN